MNKERPLVMDIALQKNGVYEVAKNLYKCSEFVGKY